MSREWQQTRFREFVLPDAVYYQSIWAVRDLRRMEERLAELGDEINAGSFGGSIVGDGRRDYSSIKPTEKKAVEKALLESRIKAIRKALETVPDSYRDFVLDNVALKKNDKGYPTKIWKIWKQRFLYNVAKNLSLL
jgi:hypothetical protein